MGQPAARVTDMHACPLVTAVVPHVGGVILPPGCPTVLIGMMPAARATESGVDGNPVEGFPVPVDQKPLEGIERNGVRITHDS